MAAGDQKIGYDGLSALAHAIRRSTAAHIAMAITPPESSIDEMLANADRIAQWIRGNAEDPPPTRWTPPVD